MWEKSYSMTVKGLEPEQIWRVWADIPNRHRWDDDIEWAKGDGPFVNGTTITFKPKGWPKTVSMKIIDCVPHQKFTDYTKFFLAGLYGIHQVERVGEELKLTTTIRVVGLLSWFWRKIVAEEIVATLPHQSALLVKVAMKT